MSDIEHLPVRPNIGVQKNNMRPRPIVSDHNIFVNSLDPDVKRVISKKDNIDNESQVTKEERITKGVKNLRDAEKSKDSSETPKNQWSSWIIISLAVIIIVLIIIIIYYVIQYNTTLLDKTIIPEDVIRPTQGMPQHMQMTPQIQQVYHPIQQAPQNSTPVKPKNFVDPTKNDLSNALKELNKSKMDSIIEEDEPVEIKEPVKVEEPIKVVKPHVEKIVELEDEDEKNEKLMENHMNASLEDLIFNDESVDAFGENDVDAFDENE